jgi:putative ABC transport system permease protein
MQGMIRIALRDLQWRSRRVGIAVVGASLVLALALVMSGLSAGFDNESARTVNLARATGWIVDKGGTGPFLQPTPLPQAKVDEIVDRLGKDHAAPLVFGRQSVRRGNQTLIGEHEHVNLVGAIPGRLGSPNVRSGSPIRGANDVVVDESLGMKPGSELMLGTRRFNVVGVVNGARLLAGVPNVYVDIQSAQTMTFRGQPLATAVVVDRPIEPPAGTKLLSNAEAKHDGLRPVVNAQKTIAMVRSLLWFVAALIVGSVMYLSVLERTKDVAVLKGMGARSRSLAGSVTMQAAILGLGASILGAAIALLIAPLFPLSAEIPPMAVVTLPLVAVAVGVVASLGAARRLFSIQPALAFGS